MIEDVFRASLSGGCRAALTVLEQDAHLASLWGEGSLLKAERLVEVWASTIALTLLHEEPDIEAVLRRISGGFAIVVFGSDVDDAYQEIRAFQLHQQADDVIREQGGIPTYAYALLRLRCLRAMGRDIDFGDIPVPIPSITELMATKILEPEDHGSIEEALLFIPAHSIGVQVAKEAYDELRRHPN